MKLPDFTLHAAFNRLRKQMGAELIDFSPTEDIEWRRLKIQLQKEGIDVPATEVDIQADGTFEYKGQKVIVYIRDQHVHFQERGSGYKFHLAQCSTLEGMERKGRYSRYVVTNRQDGKFVVNLKNKFSNEVKSNLELEMRVCKNCLNTLGLSLSPSKFSLKEFFRKYASRIRRMPKHTERTAPLNVYSDNWHEISNRLKEENDWQCEDCGGSFEERRDLLHVHHIDGDKSNNRLNNLRVLCAACHADQPGHEHMKSTRDYRRAQLEEGMMARRQPIRR